MATFSDPGPTYYADLVGHIYEAALDSSRWADVLDSLHDLYPDSRITLFAHDDGRPSAALTVQKNFCDDDLRAYVDYYVRRSPYVQRVDRAVVGLATPSERFIDDRELVRTEYYNDFLLPRRMGHYAMGVLLERRPDGLTALSIADLKNDESRRAHQRRLCEVIAPHLMRSMKLWRTVGRQQISANAAQAAFDRWLHAAFVLDAAGEIIKMNDAAAALLEREDCIFLNARGQLRSFDHKVCRTLNAAVQRCAGLMRLPDPAAADTHAGDIALPRRTSAPPLHAMISPLPNASARTELGAPRGCVLVTIFDPLQAPHTPVGWLARKFALSPAEERLTDLLVNGVTIADAAERLGIQESTARTRLKAIQAKTGCKRQLDLARMAMTAPRIGA